MVDEMVDEMAEVVAEGPLPRGVVAVGTLVDAEVAVTGVVAVAMEADVALVPGLAPSLGHAAGRHPVEAESTVEEAEEDLTGPVTAIAEEATGAARGEAHMDLAEAVAITGAPFLALAPVPIPDRVHAVLLVELLHPMTASSVVGLVARRPVLVLDPGRVLGRITDAALTVVLDRGLDGRTPQDLGNRDRVPGIIRLAAGAGVTREAGAVQEAL